MQIKVFSIPIIGGDAQNAEMNTFIRSKKVIQVEKQFIAINQNAYWSFCISYIEGGYSSDKDKPKTDYREILDEATFKRFSKMRELRKQLSKEEELPAYSIFKDEELAGMAKLEEFTLANMKNIEGIGLKKVEKYGQHFVNIQWDEKSE